MAADGVSSQDGSTVPACCLTFSHHLHGVDINMRNVFEEHSRMFLPDFILNFQSKSLWEMHSPGLHHFILTKTTQLKPFLLLTNKKQTFKAVLSRIEFFFLEYILTKKISMKWDKK